MKFIDEFWRDMKFTALGSALMLSLVLMSFANPLTHTVMGWYGAWWCWTTIQESKRSMWGRLIVGFLCWQAAYYSFMTVLNDVMVYFAMKGLANV